MYIQNKLSLHMIRIQHNNKNREKERDFSPTRSTTLMTTLRAFTEDNK